MSRFVSPETKTLTLANGDRLTVRARLSAGERRAHYSRMYQESPDGKMRANPFFTHHAVVLAYLLDWSLTDDRGQLVDIRDRTPDELSRVIDSLDPFSFEEIFQAIDAHDTAMAAARAEEKKTDGTMVS